MTDAAPTEPQNSFATGFTLGVLTGAIGYFLFATERGTKLRYQLLDEWEQARGWMVEEVIISDSRMPLREFLRDVLHKFVDFTEEVSNPEPSHRLLAGPVKKVRPAATVKPKKTSSQKFRGV